MKQWYKITAKSESADIYLHDRIGDNYGEGVSAKEFLKELHALNVGQINLSIHSPGGSVFDGLAIHNGLRVHRAQVTVRIEGLAASSASVVCMAGDIVKMPENALMMVHNPSGLVYGQSADMRKTADLLDKIQGSIVSAYQQKSYLNEDKIGEMMAVETWMSAAEAVELGFADEVTDRVNIQASLGGLEEFKYKHIPQHLFDLYDDPELAALNRQIQKGKFQGDEIHMSTGTNDDNLSIEQKCKVEWDRDPELRDEFAQDLECYVAYAKGVAAGRVRICKKGGTR